MHEGDVESSFTVRQQIDNAWKHSPSAFTSEKTGRRKKTSTTVLGAAADRLFDDEE